MPEKLQKFLNKHEKARAFFDSLNSQQRYMIVYRIHDAKRPETKDKWLKKAIEMLRNGETP